MRKKRLNIKILKISLVILMIVFLLNNKSYCLSPGKSFSESYRSPYSYEVIFFYENREIAKEYEIPDILDPNKIKQMGEIPDEILRKYYGIFYQKGNITGKIAIYYFEIGDIIPAKHLLAEWNFIDNKLEGINREFNEIGSLQATWNYKKGRLDGISKVCEHGTCSERNYKNGALNGPCNEYNAKGGLQSEVNYVDGKKEGVEKYYYDSGKLMWISNYVDGELVGVRRKYYENGNLCMEQNFKKGKLDGLSKTYFIDGSRGEDIYKRGRLINRKTFNERGDLVLERNFVTE